MIKGFESSRYWTTCAWAGTSSRWRTSKTPSRRKNRKSRVVGDHSHPDDYHRNKDAIDGQHFEGRNAG